MITLEDIKKRLYGFEYNGFKTVVEKFLKSFDIAESSIIRILDRVDEANCGPLFVYRKAVLFYNLDSSPLLFQEQCRLYKQKFPLVISFTPEGIHVCNSNEGSFFCNYENLHNYIESFQPLLPGGRQQKDAYKALDFGAIIASLFRSFREDGNTIEDSIKTIFNLIYIALFPVKSVSEVRSILNNPNATYTDKLNRILELYQDLDFITSVNITVSHDSFSYVQSLLQYNGNDIDIEILSSLVYKLFDEQDAALYGHQTSYLNVQKVISPLLLDGLKETIQKGADDTLHKTAETILDITCLDPTNSPGCFLSASILGLMELLEDIDKRLGSNYKEQLNVSNFVAIVDNRIAAELTKLTLTYSFLGEVEQIELETMNSFHSQLSVHIENALRVDWKAYTHNIDNTFIVGSPRFLGARKIKKIPRYKEDMTLVYGTQGVGSRDYCSGWLVKAAQTISHTNAKAAFVLTNSVVQGSQVAEIWPSVFDNNCEISFAYTSFKWVTTERANVGVTVVIIGLSNKSTSHKKIFMGDHIVDCEKISPYLLPNTDIIVKESNLNLFGVLPDIRKGDMPYDNGHLLLNSYQELNTLIQSDERIRKHVKRISGSEEFIQSLRRWCLWIPSEQDYEDVRSIPAIHDRIERVRCFRETSTASKKCKEHPYQFRENYSTSEGKHSLIIPSVSSENRPYIPIGFVNDKMIISNLAFAVYDCDIWVLAIITSRMHMAWVRTVCGSLETRYRYSNTLAYNTFPILPISDTDKYLLKMLVLQLLDVRERYCNISLGELYNEMPEDLAQIHKLIDDKVDALYQSTPFEDDFERVICLINMYQNRIAR